MSLLDQIPGYREAVAAEAFQRDLAFAEVPEDVAGIPVGPLNWLRFIRLALAESPFVAGGEITPQHVAATLWLLSPGYSPCAPWRRWWFFRRVRRCSYLTLCAGLEKYFHESLADAPCSRDEAFTPTYYSALAAQVDLFAHQYGWTPELILRLPFRQLFQLLRCIQSRHGHQIFFNPSDRLRGEWLKQQNQTRN